MIGLVESLLKRVVGEVLALIWFIGRIGLIRNVMMILAIEGFTLNILIPRRIVPSQLIRFIIIVTKRLGLIILIRLIQRLLWC